MLDFATTGNNIYGSSWIGPPGTQLDRGSQTMALTLLISAISLENDTVPNPTNPPTESAKSTEMPPIDKRHNTAAIVGGSVGGGLFLLSLGIGVWLLLRHHHRLQQRQQAAGGDESQISSVWTTRDGSDAVSGPSVRTNGTIEPWFPPQNHRHLGGATTSSSSRRDTISTSTSEGIFTSSQLTTEIRALRVQNLLLQERILEEECGPPPSYSGGPGQIEQHSREKGR